MKTIAFKIRDDFAESKLCQGANAIILVLRRQGFKAFWAGGAVRDLLLDRWPLDIDVATNATPQQVQAIFHRTKAVGAQFGVILVYIQGLAYEVATFRGDGHYSDGRRPDSIFFTDAKEDAMRRDFTVNGMFFDPQSNQICDYVGGWKDLQDRILRSIGNPLQRFREDRLRLLRAIRFALQLDFEIEPETMKGISDMVGELGSVSPERILEETKKIFSFAYQRSFTLLCQSRLSDSLFPYKQQLPIALWRHIETCFAYYSRINQPPDFRLALAAIWQHNGFLSPEQGDKLANNEIKQTPNKQTWPTFSSETLAYTENIMINMCLSNKDKAVISSILLIQDSYLAFDEVDLAKKKRWLRDNFFEYQISHFNCRHHQHSKAIEIGRKLMQLKKDLNEKQLHPTPLITGHDLKQLGLARGPFYSRLLYTIENSQLNNEITTKEQALSLVQPLLSQWSKP